MGASGAGKNESVRLSRDLSVTLSATNIAGVSAIRKRFGHSTAKKKQIQ
jgi:hypothetical protein